MGHRSPPLTNVRNSYRTPPFFHRITYRLFLGDIRILDILKYHALRIVKRTIQSNGGSHDFGKFNWPRVIHRQNYVFKLIIERGYLFCWIALCLPAIANSPSGYTFYMALYPPAVEHAQAGHSVQSGFHATGAC